MHHRIRISTKDSTYSTSQAIRAAMKAAVELIRPPAAAMTPSFTAFSTAETNCL